MDANTSEKMQGRGTANNSDFVALKQILESELPAATSEGNEWFGSHRMMIGDGGRRPHPPLL
jgi:hypothetical protein